MNPEQINEILRIRDGWLAPRSPEAFRAAQAMPNMNFGGIADPEKMDMWVLPADPLLGFRGCISSQPSNYCGELDAVARVTRKFTSREAELFGEITRRRHQEWVEQEHTTSPSFEIWLIAVGPAVIAGCAAGSVVRATT